MFEFPCKMLWESPDDLFGWSPDTESRDGVGLLILLRLYHCPEYQQQHSNSAILQAFNFRIISFSLFPPLPHQSHFLVLPFFSVFFIFFLLFLKLFFSFFSFHISFFDMLHKLLWLCLNILYTYAKNLFKFLCSLNIYYMQGSVLGKKNTVLSNTYNTPDIWNLHTNRKTLFK